MHKQSLASMFLCDIFPALFHSLVGPIIISLQIIAGVESLLVEPPIWTPCGSIAFLREFRVHIRRYGKVPSDRHRYSGSSEGKVKTAKRNGSRQQAASSSTLYPTHFVACAY